MNITTDTSDDATTLVLSGRFDAHEVPAFKSAVQALETPNSVVRLDLTDVRFIDSTALAELLRARSALLAQNGELQLAAVSQPVKVILELTGLEPVFSVPSVTGDEL